MAKTRKPVEAIRGQYAAIPRAVLDSTAFMQTGHHAKALLFELLRQHNGNNNGHLHLSYAWLAKRGFNSRDVVKRAQMELIEHRLVVQTRMGGLNAGPHLYALTWLNISNFIGLDLRPQEYHPGAWGSLDQLPEIKNARSVPPRGKGSTAPRYRAVPPHGKATPLAVPPHGTEKAVFGALTVPPHGNNECIPLPPTKNLRRVMS